MEEMVYKSAKNKWKSQHRPIISLIRLTHYYYQQGTDQELIEPKPSS